ncbi:MAG: PadR family transcriptional regulator [Actinobacteria bacterium]|nr:MAG: PadR family transcriptional regulator [Actinomycetota bacterium]
MLELAILGLLKERAMHGYQLKKRLSDTLGSFWQVSYGSLYPALKRLQRETAVEMIFPREQVGRRKNVYRITEKGEALFAELLERAGQEATEDSGFSVRFAFFKYLKPETRIRLLERRRAFLEGRWSRLGESVQRLKEGIDSYTLSLMNHELSATEDDIKWLDDLIKAEQHLVQEPPTRRRAHARRLPKAQQLPQRSVSR